MGYTIYLLVYCMSMFPGDFSASKHVQEKDRDVHLDLRPRKLRRRTYDTVRALQPTTFTLGLRCNFLTTPIEDRSGIKWMCFGVEKSWSPESEEQIKGNEDLMQTGRDRDRALHNPLAVYIYIYSHAIELVH